MLSFGGSPLVRQFPSPPVIITKAPITIGIIVTFMFHIFFQFSSKVEVFIFLFTFFQFYSAISRESKVDNFANSLFLLLIIMSGLLVKIRWSVCYYLPLFDFFIPALVIFNWSLNDSKYSQLSRTFLSILADLNNVVVSMVAILSPIPNSTIILSRPFEIVPSAPTIVCVTFSFIFHSFSFDFWFLVLWQDPRISLSFRFLLYFTGTAKSTWQEIFLFPLLIITRFGLSIYFYFYFLRFSPWVKTWDFYRSDEFFSSLM